MNYMSLTGFSRKLDLNVSRSLIENIPRLRPNTSVPVTIGNATVKPYAPDWDNNFTVNWSVTLGIEKTEIKKTFSGLFKCDICMWWSRGDGEQLPKFDLQNTWKFKIFPTSAAFIMIGGPLIRHFVPRLNTPSVVSYTVWQAYKVVDVLTDKFDVNVRIDARAYRSQATDGRLRPGDELNVKVRQELDVESGMIVNHDFD